MPELQQYLLAGPPAVLRPLLDLLGADPETAVHAVTRDARTDPTRLVVSMDPARADAWRVALGGVPLTIEPDAVLDL